MLSKDKALEIYKDVCETIEERTVEGEDTERLKGMKDILEVVLELNGKVYNILEDTKKETL